MEELRVDDNQDELEIEELDADLLDVVGAGGLPFIDLESSLGG